MLLGGVASITLGANCAATLDAMKSDPECSLSTNAEVTAVANWQTKPLTTILGYMKSPNI
jgi:hypothetical protein